MAKVARGDLTDAGWPRPFVADNLHGEKVVLPVAWITPAGEWTKMNPERGARSRGNLHPLARAYVSTFCQVCGEPHADSDRVVIFTKDIHRRPTRSILLQLLDEAIMHDRCARFAAHFCPHLRAKHERGNLFAFSCEVAAIVDGRLNDGIPPHLHMDSSHPSVALVEGLGNPPRETLRET